MKVLFVGLGSIGRRNLDACLRVAPNLEYAAWRSGRAETTNLQNHPKVKSFTTSQEAIQFHPDVVWVCNPTQLHWQAANALQSLKQAAFFIEKPLASNLTELDHFEEFFESRPFFYGCILRWHPLIQKTRLLIQEGSLGRPLSYSAYCGSYLPDWRPGQDYRKSYSALSQNIGVALDLIHEFDFASYWFGPFQEMHGLHTKVSGLEIESKDICAVTTKHQNQVIGQVSLNYFRTVPRRDFEIIFENGTISGDLLLGNLVTLKKTQSTIEKKEESLSISRDELHDLQARHVLESVQKPKENLWNVKEATQLIRFLLQMKG